MSSKRERYERARENYVLYGAISPDEMRDVAEYVTELEQCVKESAELKAETIRLAEQRAWEAARKKSVNRFCGLFRDTYSTFSDWKRRKTARELTQEAEELGMYDKEREGE